MSKLNEFEFRRMPPDVIEFKDQVTTILNFGKYSFQIVTTPPTWSARNGEAVFYFDSANQIHRWYFRLNNAWNFVQFSTGGGASLRIGASVVDGGSYRMLFIDANTNLAQLARLNSGELIVGSSTSVNPQIFPAGAQGQLLLSDSSQSLGLRWINSGNANSIALSSGELIAGTALSLTPIRLTAGVHGQVLVTDTSQGLWLTWVNTAQVSFYSLNWGELLAGTDLTLRPIGLAAGAHGQVLTVDTSLGLRMTWRNSADVSFYALSSGELLAGTALSVRPIGLSAGAHGQVLVVNTALGMRMTWVNSAEVSFYALNSGEILAGTALSVRPIALAAGAQGQVLIADSSQGLGLTWRNTGSLVGGDPQGISFFGGGTMGADSSRLSFLSSNFTVQMGSSLVSIPSAPPIYRSDIFIVDVGSNSFLRVNYNSAGTLKSGTIPLT